jgi:mono/diheme cytochrome c family protein
MTEDEKQEYNLKRLGVTTLLLLFVAVSFVCWWLYTGVGFFEDEMSVASSFGPRKGPRVPLPAGTVPRDGMGYDNLASPAAFHLDPAQGARLFHDQCGFCHTTDSPVATEYNPQPPNLALVVPQRTDAQLFAAISDGMATPEVNTNPPIGPRWHAFRLYLDASDRRQLVAYLRQEYPASK